MHLGRCTNGLARKQERTQHPHQDAGKRLHLPTVLSQRLRSSPPPDPPHPSPSALASNPALGHPDSSRSSVAPSPSGGGAAVPAPLPPSPPLPTARDVSLHGISPCPRASLPSRPEHATRLGRRASRPRSALSTRAYRRGKGDANLVAGIGSQVARVIPARKRNGTRERARTRRVERQRTYRRRRRKPPARPLARSPTAPAPTEAGTRTTPPRPRPTPAATRAPNRTPRKRRRVSPANHARPNLADAALGIERSGRGAAQAAQQRAGRGRRSGRARAGERHRGKGKSGPGGENDVHPAAIGSKSELCHAVSRSKDADSPRTRTERVTLPARKASRLPPRLPPGRAGRATARGRPGRRGSWSEVAPTPAPEARCACPRRRTRTRCPTGPSPLDACEQIRIPVRARVGRSSPLLPCVGGWRSSTAAAGPLALLWTPRLTRCAQRRHRAKQARAGAAETRGARSGSDPVARGRWSRSVSQARLPTPEQQS